MIGSSSAGNCYRIDDGHTALLLEAGLPIKEIQRSLQFRLSAIAGALVSHAHLDHAKSAADMLKAGIDVFGQQETFDALGLKSHRLNAILPQVAFQIGTWTILPFPLEHDCPNVGFLLANGKEKLVYITDSYFCRYKFSGLTHLMLECNHSYAILDAKVLSGELDIHRKNRLMRSHFSLENCKEFLKANDLSKVQEIHLIHLSGDNSNEEQFKREIQELTGLPVLVAGS